MALVGLYGMPLGLRAEGPPTVSYFVLNLGFAAIAAIVAGRVTGSLARHRRWTHIVALGLGLAAIALWGFSGPASQWPAWYPPILALVGLVGTLAGGLHRRAG